MTGDRHFPFRPLVAVSVAAMLLCACASSEPATPAAPTIVVRGANPTVVATMRAFFAAYNAGDLDRILSYFTDDVGLSDCDYATINWVNMQGKADVTNWIRGRLGDHDRFVVAGFFNDNPGMSLEIVGVTYTQRTNDMLRRLGKPEGITPKSATKVILTPDGTRIRAFANGPYGASREVIERECRP